MGHHPMGADVDFNPRFVAERLDRRVGALSMGQTAENLHDALPAADEGGARTRTRCESQRRAGDGVGRTA